MDSLFKKSDQISRLEKTLYCDLRDPSPWIKEYVEVFYPLLSNPEKLKVYKSKYFGSFRRLLRTNAGYFLTNFLMDKITPTVLQILFNQGYLWPTMKVYLMPTFLGNYRKEKTLFSHFLGEGCFRLRNSFSGFLEIEAWERYKQNLQFMMDLLPTSFISSWQQKQDGTTLLFYLTILAYVGFKALDWILPKVTWEYVSKEVQGYSALQLANGPAREYFLQKYKEYFPFFRFYPVGLKPASKSLEI